MFDPAYMGIVLPFAGTPNRVPSAWMLCQGQLLPISEYTALFSLIGTTFGGDGQVNFALPDLQGRVAVHSGQAPNMQAYTPGETGGNETVLVSPNNLPPHTHVLVGAFTPNPPSCSTVPGNTSVPNGNYPAPIANAPQAYSTSPSGMVNMGATVVTTPTPVAPLVHGFDQLPIDTMSPYLTMNYIICVDGIWPSQE